MRGALCAVLGKVLESCVAVGLPQFECPALDRWLTIKQLALERRLGGTHIRDTVAEVFTNQVLQPFELPPRSVGSVSNVPEGGSK